MFSRSAWLHLRIPFSFFLLPVFLFSLALSPSPDPIRVFWVFFIIHLLLYPASNGYNSYFDKDEGSIGGLRNPPPVDRGLYTLALLLDGLALVMGGILIGLQFAVMLLIYGLVSKAYSHPLVRLKKFPIVGWLAAGLFQGLFTFVMCYLGINGVSVGAALTPKIFYAGLLATAMLLGNYPVTQVYQHDEDAKRGDLTISRLLGIRGTFYFVGLVFILVFAGFIAYLTFYFGLRHSLIFGISVMPVVLFFTAWMVKVHRDASMADFSRTMWMNFLSAICLNVFFCYLLFSSNL